MSSLNLISLIAAVFSLGLALFFLLREERSFLNLIFAAGMIALGAEAGFNWLSLHVFYGETLKWQHLRALVTAVLPGIWLLFSFAYGRINYKEIISRWAWLIAAAFAVPVVLSTFWRESFFEGEPFLGSSYTWFIHLGRAGYFFHLLSLLLSILLLVNLERTLRASTGNIRWKIKFLILGIGSIFAVRIYTDSQTVLFQTFNLSLTLLNSGVLIIANGLVLKSLVRSRLIHVDFYLSPSLLFNSITLLIIGGYFLVIGLVAKLFRDERRIEPLFLIAFLIFLSCLGLAMVLLSERIRRRIKEFIVFNFKRPRYDYRKEWKEFTEATSSVTDTKEFCDRVVKRVSKTLEALSVSIWIFDEREGAFKFGGSTAFTESQVRELRAGKNGLDGMFEPLREMRTPVDLGSSKEEWAIELKKEKPGELKAAKIRYCFPLIVKNDFIGLLTLDERVSLKELSYEDIDLIKTISDQTASSLLNLTFSERLRKVKEAETIQTISSFFIHDLKNLASQLSMTIQNIPAHFDNPEFRKDAIRTLSESLAKINTLSHDLTSIRQKIELKPAENDLNDLIKKTFSAMNDSGLSILPELEPLPKFNFDPGQIEKVLSNLLFNAHEAMNRNGQIRVSTRRKGLWAVLSVSDDGCGMSSEFIESSLFHPFRSTKKEGMGIGLFHSKRIVEAHEGRIEVESEEGKGSTFRVFLPLAGNEGIGCRG